MDGLAEHHPALYDLNLGLGGGAARTEVPAEHGGDIEPLLFLLDLDQCVCLEDRYRR